MPTGILVLTLTASGITALETNHVNLVTSKHKKNYAKDGICMDEEWIDAVLGADRIVKRMRKKLYDIFMENPNVPYVDASFTMVSTGVFETLKEATGCAVITENPELGAGIYNVFVPKWSKVTDQQAASKQIPDISREAQLGGAVHGVKVKDTLKISLT